MIRIIGWLNDPNVMVFSEQRYKPHSLETQNAYLKNMNTNDEYWGVRLRDTDALIGTMAAHVDVANGVANVGILIGDKEQWGKGYGYEAWKTFCDYLLTFLRKVEAGCMAANTAMVRLCEKYQMRMEGIRDDHFYLGHSSNPYSGMVMYGKFANDKTTKI